MGSFLPLIEAAFTPVLEKYGFELRSRTVSTPPAYAEFAVYARAQQSVSVCYAETREQWCEVSVGGYGDPEPVTDLLGFVRGTDQSDVHYLSVNVPDAFAREAERCCRLLVEYCADFLQGDIGAFRMKYRELFLVAAVRNARYNAVAQRQRNEAERYDQWLKDYE